MGTTRDLFVQTETFVLFLACVTVKNRLPVPLPLERGQFRTTRLNADGTTQQEVVNDVWHAQVDNTAGTLNFRITVIKEYLDGRVRTLQAQNVLQLLEGETDPFLTPWPPFVPGREMCFPIVTNTCDAVP